VKRKLIVALCLAVSAAAVVATSISGATKADGITVWLQVDAQSGWPDVIAAANKQFQADHPGVNVDVQYQTWDTHLQKFDATLAGGNAPDVLELGNTEMTKYMAAGAFADLTPDKAKFPNSSNWLKGLAQSATYNGKTFGVPYYAGSRIVIYRTDMFNKAGIKKTPTSLADFLTAGKKLNATFGKTDPTFSPFYVAGPDWYSALAYVYDFGGKVAKTSKGKWVGTLDEPPAIQGLTAFKQIFDTMSKASKTQDEAHPFPTTPFSQDHAASFIGPGWQFGYALDPKAGKPALKDVMSAFAMPSHTPGKTMPAFLGGSDLAIPITSKQKALAEDWIKDFTSSSSMAGIVKAGNLPNATSLLNLVTGNPGSQLAKAAQTTWFVPTAKNWTNVENANVLRNMLTEILTGKSSVKAAATAASKQITTLLNAST
jgi:N,N'-diacetylchitobiose transport system substrate-binding protein